jgi:hypothetical protein
MVLNQTRKDVAPEQSGGHIETGREIPSRA